MMADGTADGGGKNESLSKQKKSWSPEKTKFDTDWIAEFEVCEKLMENQCEKKKLSRPEEMSDDALRIQILELKVDILTVNLGRALSEKHRFQAKYQNSKIEISNFENKVEKVIGEKSEDGFNLRIRLTIDHFSDIFKLEKRIHKKFFYDSSKINSITDEDERKKEKLYQLWSYYLQNPPNGNFEVSSFITRIENFSFKKVVKNPKTMPTDPAGKKELTARLISELWYEISKKFHVKIGRLQPVQDIRLYDSVLFNEVSNLLLGEVENAAYTIKFVDGSVVKV